MQKVLLIVLLIGTVGLSYCLARQSPIGQWKNFTTMQSVRALAVMSGRVAAATGGGMFLYDTTSGLFSQWTNSENLSSNDLTSLMVDNSNRIWVGSSGGTIDVYDEAFGSWRSIRDIANSNQAQKAIREFVQKGDTVYAASDFGVSVFIPSRWEFGDTYASFGFPIQPVVTQVLVHGGQIFVGTDQGLARAPLSEPNLSAPTSWSIYTNSQGLTTTRITAMTVFHDTLLVGTAGGMFYFDGSLFRQLNSTSGKPIVGIVATAGSFTYLWNGSGGITVESSGHIDGSSTVVVSLSSVQATSFTEDSVTSTIFVGTTTRGIAEWNGTEWTYTVPNGPRSNLFVGLSIDENGVVWSASGIDGGGEGFYRYDPSRPLESQWKNFSVADYSVMRSNDYFSSAQGADGSVWISSWGAGVVEVAGDTIRRRIDQSTVPSLAASVPQDPTFVVVGGSAVDPSGATWFVNYLAVNGNFLAKLVNDTAFQYFRSPVIASSGYLTSLVIDQKGTKWMANSEPTKKTATGLYFFNEEESVAGTTDTDGWGVLTTSDGLPNNTILSLAVDVDNNVWVGTDLGVAIITNPQSPRSGVISSFPLREQSIQAIAVDGLNNKWIGTKEGVFVVNADGTQLLNQYTVTNTGGKLVDNDVRSIALDQQRGIVYIGTQSGLSSLQIAAVQPLQSYTTLKVGPNPYVLPNLQPMSINNLVANSTVKILAVNGTLVNEFAAQGGGRAFWDGRDLRGNYVPTGIYFVVAFAENGNQVANGKFAIVRK
jgi:ligand-binding sensor domain-containing protein